MTPAQITEAQRLRATGVSLRDIAAQLGVSHSTVRRALQAVTVAPADESPEPSPREPEPLDLETPDEPEGPVDEVTYLRALRERFLGLSARCEAKGNLSAAQRAARDGAALSPVIARLERSRRDEGDVFRLSRSEIEDAYKGIVEKFQMAMAERGELRCADCERRLSATLARPGQL